MAKQIVWTKRTDKKFDRVVEYIEAEWGERTATEFVTKFYEFLDVLKEFPEVGTLERENIRGFPITKQTTLFYRVEDKKIILLNLFDNRKNPNRKSY